ncbi:unnamed protein product [Cuscuta epithymum]|nr:unnamed protein product [Cuscuta epithymum]
MKKSRQPPARKLIMQRTTRFAAEKRKEQSNSMKMFSMLVDKCLGDGYMVEHDAEVFGFATKSIFNKDVCGLVINFEQVNNSVVEIWSRHLHEKMLQDGGNMPVQFGTSAAVPVPLKSSDESITRRSRYIADLLAVGLLGQITLIPYNTCNHWVLVAIDITAWTVYYLDSIGEKPSEDLSLIVNQGVKIHHASVSKKRLSLNWVTVMCPKQTGSMECGYFLMKYMSDIVCDVNVLKKNFSTIKDYSEQDILQVREEWAAYATKLVLKCG